MWWWRVAAAAAAAVLQLSSIAKGSETPLQYIFVQSVRRSIQNWDWKLKLNCVIWPFPIWTSWFEMSNQETRIETQCESYLNSGFQISLLGPDWDDHRTTAAAAYPPGAPLCYVSMIKKLWIYWTWYLNSISLLAHDLVKQGWEIERPSWEFTAISFLKMFTSISVACTLLLKYACTIGLVILIATARIEASSD